MAQVLTTIERQSAVFQKLVAYYTVRLEALRRTNDGNLSEVSTAKVRGQIFEVNELLKLGIEQPLVPLDPVDQVRY